MFSCTRLSRFDRATVLGQRISAVHESDLLFQSASWFLNMAESGAQFEHLN